MKRTTFFLLPVLLASQSAWADTNPFFGDKTHQVALNMGIGIDSGFLLPPPLRLVPFTITHFQYSLPTTFFEMPARQSLNLAMTVGFADKYGWDWADYSIPIGFLSEDVALFYGDDWYFAAGLGVGMQGQQNERLGSKLLFQFKLLFGYRISDCINAEVFMQHFSNGNTATENYSYAFYGLGVVYNF